MEILDGKLASKAIREDLGKKISVLKESGKKVPHLAAVLIGNNPASETYVASKVKTVMKLVLHQRLNDLMNPFPKKNCYN